ncbi:hypothetical protein RIF29_08756 [Crotalaria pallida]|uniref:Uncharacterized protein n=1 Tax=Crotalaria pallida TaxID=3830 RepID=A0AAN9IKF2_CROPI
MPLMVEMMILLRLEWVVVVECGVEDRYRDSLRRILELALPMHQSGVLDPHAIQQIVTSALDLWVTLWLLQREVATYHREVVERIELVKRIEVVKQIEVKERIEVVEQIEVAKGGRAEHGDDRRVRARRG